MAGKKRGRRDVPVQRYAEDLKRDQRRYTVKHNLDNEIVFIQLHFGGKPIFNVSRVRIIDDNTFVLEGGYENLKGRWQTVGLDGVRVVVVAHQ